MAINPNVIYVPPRSFSVNTHIKPDTPLVRGKRKIFNTMPVYVHAPHHRTFRWGGYGKRKFPRPDIIIFHIFQDSRHVNFDKQDFHRVSLKDSMRISHGDEIITVRRIRDCRANKIRVFLLFFIYNVWVFLFVLFIYVCLLLDGM